MAKKTMRKTFLTKIRETLEAERNTIMMRAQQSDVDNLDYEGDEVDNIQGNIIAFTSAKLAARDKERVMKINAALEKVRNGIFGVCEECEGEIAEKRLQINPSVNLCIDCQEDLEMARKRGQN